LVNSPAGTRTLGLSAAGEPSWLFQSAPQAHRSFAYYNPGDWYDYQRDEKVLSVTLHREDGKEWKKPRATVNPLKDDVIVGIGAGDGNDDT